MPRGRARTAPLAPPPHGPALPPPPIPPAAPRARPAPAPAAGAGAGLSGTNLERAGDYNQRVVLQAIRIHGPITRTELAELSGLTSPAIANITRRLAAEQLIVDAGQRRGGRGQPATRVAVNPDGALSLGVNIDRDHVTALVLDLSGQMRARASRETGLLGPAAAAALVREMVDGLLSDAALRPRLLGAGLAAPDDLDRVDLPALHPAAGWAGADLAALFSEALRLPVLVENDAAAAAIGELQFGHGLRHPSFFYVLITAGLGGGLVVEGDYFRGANGRSGEIGFLPLHLPGTPARTLQEAVSLSALYAHLAACGVHVEAPSGLDALEGAAAARVEDWLDAAADILTEPLMAVSWLINPAAILLGGRLPPRLIDGLAARLTRRLSEKAKEMPGQTPVLRAMASEDAPAMGAAILPFLQQLLPSRANLMKVAEG